MNHFVFVINFSLFRLIIRSLFRCRKTQIESSSTTMIIRIFSSTNICSQKNIIMNFNLLNVWSQAMVLIELVKCQHKSNPPPAHDMIKFGSV